MGKPLKEGSRVYPWVPCSARGHADADKPRNAAADLGKDEHAIRPYLNASGRRIEQPRERGAG